jgi:hypothetical protein
MDEYKFYYPYKSTKRGKKFMVLTSDGKWIFFGDSPYEHYTEVNLDEKIRIKKEEMLFHKKNLKLPARDF